MSNQYSICLLGFAPESEGLIKKIIESNKPQSLSIQWVPANYQNLNVVVVNAVFIEAPQIKKYLNNVGAIVVSAANNSQNREEALSQNLKFLDLSNYKKDASSWLSYLFQVEVNSEEKSSDNSNKLDNLFKLLDGKNKIIRLTYGENISWVKLEEGTVVINYPRDNIPGIDKWSYEIVSEDDIDRNLRQIKLDLWLFETIWQSEVVNYPEINEENYYRLTRWPQPLGKFGRTEALRLAACAQSYPVNIKVLKEKTAYPNELIKRFLLAASKAGQLSIIYQAPTENNAAESAPKLDRNKAEEKRGLLRMLRSKLKLGF